MSRIAQRKQAEEANPIGNSTQKEERKRTMKLLRGNKEIAEHLKITERTLREWAKNDPTLEREIVKTQGTVYAFAEMLDAWILSQAGKTRKNTEESGDDVRQDKNTLVNDNTSNDSDNKEPVTSEHVDGDKLNANRVSRNNRGKRGRPKARP